MSLKLRKGMVFSHRFTNHVLLLSQSSSAMANNRRTASARLLDKRFTSWLGISFPKKKDELGNVKFG